MSELISPELEKMLAEGVGDNCHLCGNPLKEGERRESIWSEKKYPAAAHSKCVDEFRYFREAKAQQPQER